MNRYTKFSTLLFTNFVDKTIHSNDAASKERSHKHNTKISSKSNQTKGRAITIEYERGIYLQNVDVNVKHYSFFLSSDRHWRRFRLDGDTSKTIIVYHCFVKIEPYSPIWKRENRILQIICENFVFVIDIDRSVRQTDRQKLIVVGNLTYRHAIRLQNTVVDKYLYF